VSGESVQSVVPGHEPPVTPATTASRRAALLLWLGAAAGCAAVLAGFLGLDRWFYLHVSCALNTEVVGRDFYHATMPFWLLCRWFFGYALAALLILGADLALRPRRWCVIVGAALAIAAAGLSANLLQAAIGRARPNHDISALSFEPVRHLLDKQGVSFPSGEAATAFAVALVLSRLYPRWRIAFYIGGTLAAVARLVNGAHYPSDVAAGALFGTFVAGLVLGWAVKQQTRLRARC
jgi:membrane-associated phospholipid phosphatase